MTPSATTPAGRHLLQKAKDPVRPKAVRGADSVARSFGRMTPSATTPAGRR
jgi:hypothetical protein